MKCLFILVTLLLPNCHSFSIARKCLPSTRSRSYSDLQAHSQAMIDGRKDGENVPPEHDKHDSSHWKIWHVIKELETNGLSSNSDNRRKESQVNNEVTYTVVQILRLWGDLWAGQSEWQSLLNKRSLLHEVEESIVALQFLVDWLDERCMKNDNTAVILVDVCCGKGILSMLASYLFRGKTLTHVSSIIMLDKQQDINWNHR